MLLNTIATLCNETLPLTFPQLLEYARAHQLLYQQRVRSSSSLLPHGVNTPSQGQLTRPTDLGRYLRRFTWTPRKRF